MPKVNPIDSAMRHSEVLWFHFSIKMCQTNCLFCIKQNKWWIELTMEVRVWPLLAWLMNWTTMTHELNFAAKWTEHIKLLTSLYLVQMLFPLIQIVWYYSRSFFQLADVLKINSVNLRKIGMESVRFEFCTDHLNFHPTSPISFPIYQSQWSHNNHQKQKIWLGLNCCFILLTPVSSSWYFLLWIWMSFCYLSDLYMWKIRC